MSGESLGYLLRQLETAWMLTSYHLDGLTTDECLWRPAAKGLHVHRVAEGWRADWPDREGYDIGPPSIAWLTWHIGFWWSMVHDHSFGAATLSREDAVWPGTADAVRAWLGRLHGDWRAALEKLTDEDLRSAER
ncbi:MAG: DinB family protein, partial [Myxococcales bacterium]|nr:DinB family protein [Myxococcales bacterium]